jgi:hypothetical protein
MRLRIVACVLLISAIFPVAAQDRPLSFVQLLEERFRAVRQLAEANCSQLVALSALARIQRTDEFIRRRFPVYAEQFDRTSWPMPPGYEQVQLAAVPSAVAAPYPEESVTEEYAPSPASSPGGPDESMEPTGQSTAPANPAAEPAVVDYTHDGHFLSYTATAAAEILLGTYVPGEVPGGGGYFLFYLKNNSNQPIHVSPHHFQLTDLDYDRPVKLKTPDGLRRPFHLMAKVGGALSALTFGLAGPGNPSASSMAFSMTEPQQAANQATQGTGSSREAGVQVDPEARLDEEVVRKLEGIYALKLDWRSGSKDFILSDNTVLPGQELIRIVLTEKSSRNHRHLLTFRNGGLSASLQGAEKGLR